MNTTLPDAITEELYDLDHTPSDVCLDYISEIVESHGFDAEDAATIGVLCRIRFHNAFVSGELHINRHDHNFTISARTLADGGMYLPQTGPWKMVISYLRTLSKEKGDSRWNTQVQ